MNKEKKHPSQYLNDLEEWQENQYNPGYWLGGNIPPIFKYHNSSKKPLGIIFIFIGIFTLLFTFVPIILYGESFPECIYDNISALVIGSLFGIILNIAGIKILHRNK